MVLSSSLFIWKNLHTCRALWWVAGGWRRLEGAGLRGVFTGATRKKGGKCPIQDKEVFFLKAKEEKKKSEMGNAAAM